MSKKQVYMIIAVTLAVCAAIELCGVHMHSPAWWPLPFSYDVFFGFCGCWLLIILAKLIMAPLLQRDESYYDGGDDDE